MVWEFQTPETALRWADLWRDMLPVASYHWESMEGWEPRWSVAATLARHSWPARPSLVTVRLWAEPARFVQ